MGEEIVSKPSAPAPSQTSNSISAQHQLTESELFEVIGIQDEAIAHRTSISSSRRHEWSMDDRKMLKCLKDGFQADWSTLVPLFNLWIQSNRPSASPLTKGQMLAQYHEAFKPSGRRLKSRAYYEGLRVSAADEIRLKATIETIANRVGILLDNANYMSIVTTTSSTPKNVKRRLVSSDEEKLADDHREDTSEEELRIPSRPKRRCKDQAILQLSQLDYSLPKTTDRNDLRNWLRLPNRSLSPTPTQQRYSRPARTQRPTNQQAQAQLKPAIVYRGFSPKSQGVNGSDGFKAGAFIPERACPSPESEAFRFEATSHVGWHKRASPFISVTVSPIRAIMKARSTKQDRWLAIIDFDRLQDAVRIFDAKELNLHPVREDGTVIPYQPGGEFIVWNHIPGACIINVITIDELASDPPSIPEIDKDPLCLEFITTAWRRVATRTFIQKKYKGHIYFSYQIGFVIGQLIRRFNVPRKYADPCVQSVVSDWGFRANTCDKWREDAEFALGVHRGLDSDHYLGFAMGETMDLTNDDYYDNLFEVAADEYDDEEHDDLVIVKQEGPKDDQREPHDHVVTESRSQPPSNHTNTGNRVEDDVPADTPGSIPRSSHTPMQGSSEAGSPRQDDPSATQDLEVRKRDQEIQTDYHWAWTGM